MRRSFLGTRGCIVERSHDIDVMSDGGRRQMPGAAIAVLVIAGKRGGEGAVRIAALARCSGAVDRRADKRMPELEPSAVDENEPRLLRRLEPPLADAEGLRCTRHHADVLRVVSSGDEQEATGLLRQPPNTLVKNRLELLGHRQRLGQRLLAGQLRLRQHRRQLDQSQRVATCSSHEAFAHREADPDGSTGEQDAGRVRVKPRQRQRRNVGGLERAHVSFTGGEDERDALGVQAPRDEPQRIRRRCVQPMRVIDEAQHGPPLRQLGEERETSREDEEALVRIALLETESGANCRRLGLRQSFHVVERRP